MEPNKKIGILTQPLEHNYGGLLQAYALCEVLRQKGFDPIVLDRKTHNSPCRKLLSNVKTIIYKLLGRKRKFVSHPTLKEKSYIYQATDYFIQKYIPNQILLSTNSLDKYVKTNSFYAYIVGSDQVWRPRYSPNLATYFLDFCKNNKLVKKLSYAASFGVSDWEYSMDESQMANRLIKKFDAVSVREDSGVDLCRDYLNTKAVHVLDPTLLLNKDSYVNLFLTENEKESKGSLFTYILDDNPEKKKIVTEYESILGLEVYNSQPKVLNYIKEEARMNIENLEYPSVTKWLKSFNDAEFVITDSFHGCVFSIIFNKPFIALINEGRGASRFYSLLNSLDLQHRIYNQGFKNDDINWETVNLKLKSLRTESMTFLKNNLDE